MKTRGMQGLTANRISSETVTLNYPTYVDSGDGSAVVTPVYIISPASVGALQPNDIQRLEKAGIIVTGGVAIVIPSAPSGQPDSIAYGGKVYRVVDWSMITENGNNTVVATCDEGPIAGVV
jgi:hypothetical protein